jgi:nitrous oxide reductase accessory protein NosL
VSKFNIRQDLASRQADDRLEIISISGPSAQWVMKNLSEKNYSAITERFGITVNPVAAENLVAKYAPMILSKPNWKF